MRSLIFLLSLFFFSNLSFANQFDAFVTRVVDGDTIWVLDDNARRYKIRFLGIDAPESDQPYGDVCTQLLSSYLINKRVSIRYTKEDKYGRLLGTVILDGGNVNLQMVSDGCAWVYRYYDKDLPKHVAKAYYKAETKARDSKYHLWEGNPVEPWRWRRGERIPNPINESSVVIKVVKTIENFLF